MKGISTIIATIIFVVITIGLVSTAYLFFGGVLTRTTSKVISVVDAEAHKVIVRNDGTDTVASDEISISVNGQEAEIINPQFIDPQDTAVLKFVPPELETKSAKFNVLGPSNTLSYTTDIVPQESKATSDTVGLWHFNEGSGTLINDESIYNNDGVSYSGNPPIQTDLHTPDGKFGSALIFDGLDDFANVSHSDSLNITDAVTVQAWVKVEDTEDFNDIVNKDSYDLWLESYTGGENYNEAYAQFSGVSPGNLESNAVRNITLGEWYHVAVTYDKDGGENNFNLYVNGMLVDSKTSINPINDNENPVRIGTYGPPDFFNGTIDEIVIYNRSLTQEEILDSIYG